MSAEFLVFVCRFTFSLLSTSPYYSALSFDDLIRPRQHIGWNRETDLLGRLEIDL